MSFWPAVPIRAWLGRSLFRLSHLSPRSARDESLGRIGGYLATFGRRAKRLQLLLLVDIRCCRIFSLQVELLIFLRNFSLPRADLSYNLGGQLLAVFFQLGLEDSEVVES